MLFSGINSFAQKTSLEKILKNHYKAIGLDYLKEVNTIEIYGTILRQDAMPVKYVKMRPNKYLMEFNVADLTTYRAYNGKIVWHTMPWRGVTNPTKMPNQQAKSIINSADFDGCLVNWKEKGHQLKYIEKIKENDEEYYKLEVVLKGSVEPVYHYINTKTYLLYKKEKFVKKGENKIKIETIFSDYKEIENILFAFKLETLQNGMSIMVIEYDDIELDVKVDEKIFDMN